MFSDQTVLLAKCAAAPTNAYGDTRCSASNTFVEYKEHNLAGACTRMNDTQFVKSRTALVVLQRHVGERHCLYEMTDGYRGGFVSCKYAVCNESCTMINSLLNQAKFLQMY